jgi:heterodisulfide reductase subunit A
MPATVTLGGSGKPVVRSSGETDLEITETEYDLVILSVGMRPQGADSDLAKSLGVAPDRMGFAPSRKELEAQGVFVCGAVTEPMDIEEAASRAIAAASRIAGPKEARP